MKFSKKYLFLFIVAMLSGLLLYHNQSSNPELAYWKYMISRDPKPRNISEEAYFSGNQQGMCWRDNKIYSKDELLQKAKWQFLIYIEKKLDDYKAGRILDASEENYLDTDIMCQKNPVNCQLYQSKLTLKKDKLVKFLEKDNNVDKVLETARKFSAQQEYVENLNQTYFARYHNFQTFFSVDCCTVQKTNQFFDFVQSKDGKQFVLLMDKLSQFMENETVKNLGLNNSLFLVNSIDTHIDTQDNRQTRVKNVYDTNIYKIFILNNCGDIFLISEFFNII